MSLISRRVDEDEKKRQAAFEPDDDENCREKVTLMMRDPEIYCSSIEIAATRRNETEILPQTFLSHRVQAKQTQKAKKKKKDNRKLSR